MEENVKELKELLNSKKKFKSSIVTPKSEKYSKLRRLLYNICVEIMNIKEKLSKQMFLNVDIRDSRPKLSITEIAFFQILSLLGYDNSQYTDQYDNFEDFELFTEEIRERKKREKIYSSTPTPKHTFIIKSPETSELWSKDDDRIFEHKYYPYESDDDENDLKNVPLNASKSLIPSLLDTSRRKKININSEVIKVNDGMPTSSLSKTQHSSSLNPIFVRNYERHGSNQTLYGSALSDISSDCNDNDDDGAVVSDCDINEKCDFCRSDSWKLDVFDHFDINMNGEVEFECVLLIILLIGCKVHDILGDFIRIYGRKYVSLFGLDKKVGVKFVKYFGYLVSISDYEVTNVMYNQNLIKKRKYSVEEFINIFEILFDDKRRRKEDKEKEKEKITKNGKVMFQKLVSGLEKAEEKATTGCDQCIVM